MRKLEREFIQHLYHEIEDEEKAYDQVLDIVHMVGFVAMYFNGLEQQLNNIICESFSDRSDYTGLLVIHNMTYASKVDLFKRFEDQFENGVAPVDGYNQLLWDMKECGRLRNLVVHADWENSDQDGYAYVNLKINKSGLKQEYIQFSAESLEKITNMILKTRINLSSYWEKRNDILYGR